MDLKLKRYVIKPSLQMLGVMTVTGEQTGKIAQESNKDEEGNKVSVNQSINGLSIFTELKTSYKTKNGNKFEEVSNLTMTVKKGQKLVYVENKGFVIPERAICTPEEAIKDLNTIKED